MRPTNKLASGHCSIQRSGRLCSLDGRDVGVLCLEREEGGLFLANIEILPPFQNRGIGTRIIEDILASARRDCLPVRLQVLKVNPARRLYERLGIRGHR